MRTVIVILLAALTALCSAQEIPTLASTTAAAAPAATVTAPQPPLTSPASSNLSSTVHASQDVSPTQFSTLATLCALYPKTTPADNLATVRTTAKSSRASSREMWLEESNVTRVVTVVLSIFVARVAYYFS
ncbi:hypothetical protein BC829DRAFT_448169 [Chytridium lagenaria]|nr:hypothetical protein BC829DRAFT_448169 [Chytridium lagenaria]